MTQEMIVKRLKIIEELRNELNSLKSNYDEMLEDDEDYQEFEEEKAQARREQKEKKEKVISKNSMYLALDQELKEKRRELRENKEALSMDLADYYKENGTLEIVDHEGNVRRMKFSVRLVS